MKGLRRYEFVVKNVPPGFVCVRKPLENVFEGERRVKLLEVPAHVIPFRVCSWEFARVMIAAALASRLHGSRQAGERWSRTEANAGESIVGGRALEYENW